MVTKKIRSEYMKKFKDPKWETYTKCYEEMLMYRLTRRLLEHTHNPWFWAGSESDSDSGGRSPPPPPPPLLLLPSASKELVQSRTSRDHATAELEECEGARQSREQIRITESVLRLPLQEGEESAEHGSQLEGVKETRVSEEEKASSQGSQQKKLPHRGQNRVKDTGGRQQSKSSKTQKQAWRSQRVRPAQPQPPEGDSKESKHPFALYGSGEKDADMAARKTHNVIPVASTNEIHDSALRAKTRREVERQIQTQRAERRRSKSADLNKARKLVQPEYNPWLTEYMRCFSARSR
ncbi:centriole, cilia and spindle-associated protein [Labrus mixtus]|uniref:centriole, cilia and spindle-associated protein n=1 Tax=Labrus mixtus TaxID=508554 RepID=UPI0029C06504|nr:centriole, cilia and spindle-associated protein [Labrus mixtus]XP_060897094.1 centriole, cilia and spindle-associated protein [Labrus mixtus]